jgi:endonuclease/exonuclease/phosphatase family metal-dependent hydrolase
VLINLHLAAWDAKGDLRKQELAFLREFAITQYSQGSYVVIGGDWNAVLPGVRTDQFPSRDKPNRYLMTMPHDSFPSEWHWGVETSHPSNRQVSAPYEPGKTYVTVIDGFVASPNVRIESVEAIPLNFKDSDHEPVTISVTGP